MPPEGSDLIFDHRHNAVIRANLFLARRRPLLAYGRSLLRLAEPVHGAAEPAVAVSSGDWVRPAAAGSRP
jgi:hypothetical protein